jgi:hypothetical protein
MPPPLGLEGYHRADPDRRYVHESVAAEQKIPVSAVFRIGDTACSWRENAQQSGHLPEVRVTDQLGDLHPGVDLLGRGVIGQVRAAFQRFKPGAPLPLFLALPGLL